MRNRFSESVVYLAEILVAHLGRDCAETTCLYVLFQFGKQFERLLCQHGLNTIVNNIPPTFYEFLEINK